MSCGLGMLSMHEFGEVMGEVSSWEILFFCWVWSHAYLVEDKRVGEAAALDRSCSPILLVLCLC